MEKVRYMISDAADMVHVESHVLRYWEEELDLNIPRNEMGHRYYTRENIKEFQKIKDLKEQGYQLKSIRMILHTGKLPENPEQDMQMEMRQTETEKEERLRTNQAGQPILSPRQMVSGNFAKSQQMTVTAGNGAQQLSPEDRMCQFRELMSDIVGQAIVQNNEELSQTIGRDVHEMVLKEMNYLMREQDEAQEERYRKLDEAIRGNIKKKRGFFSKKEKKEKKEKK